jgi:hypothetical protein
MPDAAAIGFGPSARRPRGRPRTTTAALEEIAALVREEAFDTQVAEREMAPELKKIKPWNASGRHAAA